MAPRIIPVSRDEQGSLQNDPAQAIRDALADTHQRLEAQQPGPAALDLLARVLAAMAPSLRGVASQLAGHHAPQHWREALRGERTLALADLCRLALHPSREARTAVAAALAVLAAPVDYRLEPEGRALGTGAHVGAALAQHSGCTMEVLFRALQDGRVDEREKAEILPLALHLQQVAADVVTLARPGGVPA